MIKSMKVLLGIALTVMASLAFGGGDPGVRVVTYGDHSFSLEIGSANEDFEVFLLNEEGKTLYSAEVEHGGVFKEVFDLQLLQKGDYQIKIVDALKVRLIPVLYSEQALVINLDQVEYRYFPVINQRENVITVSGLNFSGRAMDVRVEDAYGATVFSDRIFGEVYIGKKFDFNKVKGKYTVVVNNGGLISTKIVDIY